MSEALDMKRMSATFEGATRIPRAIWVAEEHHWIQANGTFIGFALLLRRADGVKCIGIIETIRSWINPSLATRRSGRFGDLQLLILAMSLGASKCSARGEGLGTQNP
jgi:hypothetical protein